MFQLFLQSDLIRYRLILFKLDLLIELNKYEMHLVFLYLKCEHDSVMSKFTYCFLIWTWSNTRAPRLCVCVCVCRPLNSDCSN